MAKKGVIQSGSLEKIFAWVERGSHTGTLAINKGEQAKYIFFDKGKIVHAHSLAPADQLEAYLLRSGLLSRKEIISAKQASEQSKSKNFLKSLLSLNLVPKEQILKLKKQQVKDITIAALQLTTGGFIFYPDKLPSGGYVQFAFPIGKMLKLLRRGAAPAGMEQAKPTTQLQIELPPDASVYEVSSHPDARTRFGSLSSEEQDIMVLYDGRRTMKDVQEKSRFPKDWTRLTIRKLLNLNLLQEVKRDLEFDIAQKAHAAKHYYKAHEKIKEILAKTPSHPKAQAVQRQFANDLLMDIKEKIGTLRSIPALKQVDFNSWQNLKLDQRSMFLLSRIDGNSNLKQLISVTTFSKGEVCMVIYALLELGLITLTSPSGQQVTKEPTASETFRTSVDISEEDDHVVHRLLQKYEVVKRGDFYKILGVKNDAKREEIKGAFIRLSKEFHPDALKGKAFEPYNEQIDDVFSKIKLSYDTLKNETTRSKYDESLGLKMASRETVVKKRTNAKAKLQYSIAMKCIKRRDWNRAIEFLRSALDLEQDEPVYHGRLAELLSKNMRTLDEAQEHLDIAIKLDPHDPFYYLVSGTILKNQRKIDDAVKAYYKVLSLDRSNQQAIEMIEELTGKPAEIPTEATGGQLIIRKPGA